ncbi:hypothetical protein JZ751_004116 [Albula glossodonta]|uniref:Uncharacterized protein n=1 Tax=Albula glossodonta TaxID=121402 RepID=A0A8T2PA51_9TELE|nr:hypothetical protein JZ751_004116 [Albula glossodonta]
MGSSWLPKARRRRAAPPKEPPGNKLDLSDFPGIPNFRDLLFQESEGRGEEQPLLFHRVPQSNHPYPPPHPPNSPQHTHGLSQTHGLA